MIALTKQRAPSEGASVLVVTMMTLTVMTFICATSLYVVSQNTSSGMQTAGWQQALTGAESGIDAAMRALNADASPAAGAQKSDAWTKAGWRRVASTTLPATEAAVSPSPTASATAPPSSSSYNYLPSSQLTVGSFTGSEGSSQVTSWVTIDTAGMTASSAGQWYRVRAVGQTKYPANAAILRQAPMNRLDAELRNTVALKFSRLYGGTAVTQTTQGATRMIEAVLSPVTSSIWGQGILLKGALTMSGGGTIDHFNSNSVSTHQYSTALRSSDYTETLVAMLNASGSGLANTYVYGNISYSTAGAAPKNTTNVLGGLTSPYNGSAPSVSNPTWSADVSYASAPGTLTPSSSNSSATNPYKVKVNGSLTVSGGKSMLIKRPNNGSTMLYVEIWTTGDLTTSGTGYISVEDNIHVTYFVDGKVTTSGSSMNSASGTGQAQNNQIVVIGGGDVTISGSGQFIGTIDAPDSKVTISGSGSVVGAIIGDTLTISGGASFHYDDALATYGGGSVTTCAYAFASWFEDNSAVKRLDANLNRIIY